MFRAPCTGWVLQVGVHPPSHRPTLPSPHAPIAPPHRPTLLPSSHPPPIVPPSYVTPEQIAGGVSVLKDLNFSVDGLGKMPKGVPVIRR